MTEGDFGISMVQPFFIAELLVSSNHDSQELAAQCILAFCSMMLLTPQACVHSKEPANVVSCLGAGV